MVDLVAEHEEWGPRELLHRQQRVQLGLGLGEALQVLGVDEEDDAGDLGEVVAPEPAGLCVATEVESGEFNLERRGVSGMDEEEEAVMMLGRG